MKPVQKPGLLMVRLRDWHTNAIHEFNGRQWISAGYYKQLIANGRITQGEYALEYKRKEAKCDTSI